MASNGYVERVSALRKGGEPKRSNKRPAKSDSSVLVRDFATTAVNHGKHHTTPTTTNVPDRVPEKTLPASDALRSGSGQTAVKQTLNETPSILSSSKPPASYNQRLDQGCDNNTNSSTMKEQDYPQSGQPQHNHPRREMKFQVEGASTIAQRLCVLNRWAWVAIPIFITGACSGCHPELGKAFLKQEYAYLGGIIVFGLLFSAYMTFNEKRSELYNWISLLILHFKSVMKTLGVLSDKPETETQEPQHGAHAVVNLIKHAKPETEDIFQHSIDVHGIYLTPIVPRSGVGLCTFTLTNRAGLIFSHTNPSTLHSRTHVYILRHQILHSMLGLTNVTTSRLVRLLLDLTPAHNTTTLSIVDKPALKALAEQCCRIVYSSRDNYTTQAWWHDRTYPDVLSQADIVELTTWAKICLYRLEGRKAQIQTQVDAIDTRLVRDLVVQGLPMFPPRGGKARMEGANQGLVEVVTDKEVVERVGKRIVYSGIAGDLAGF